jgi:DNA-binding GntR family transcriptional regulator
MEPGMRLREARIARELQTSRAPVREAIGQLVQEGWATKRANESARIIAPTATRLREAATLRGVLEGYAVGLAMTRLDPHGIDVIAGLVTGMQQAVNEGDLSRAYELDLAFHEAVVRASGHQLLYDMWKRMGGHIRFLVSGTGVMDRDLRRTVELHRRILAAFRKGDAARAAGLMGIDPREVEQLVARVAPAARLAKPPARPRPRRAPADAVTAALDPVWSARWNGVRPPRGAPAPGAGPAIAAEPDSRAALSADQGVRQNDHQDR